MGKISFSNIRSHAYFLNKIAKIETKAAFPHTGSRGAYIIKVHNLYKMYAIHVRYRHTGKWYFLDTILISKINFTVPVFVCETIMVAMRITERIVKGFGTQIESIMTLRYTSRCLNVILIYNESRNECKICTLLPQLGMGDFYILHGYVHYTSWILYMKWNTLLQQNNK